MHEESSDINEEIEYLFLFNFFLLDSEGCNLAWLSKLLSLNNFNVFPLWSVCLQYMHWLHDTATSC